MSTLDATRDKSGKLPGIAWPGGYSILYLTDDGAILCADCANGGNGSEASTTADPGSGWLIVAGFVHWEGAPDYCAHCNAELVSEYGDPDADEGGQA